jgi:UDP-glucose 4-epimerase
MRVIVTGGAGFIGFNLCQELNRRGYEVHVVDDLSSGRKENIVTGVTYVFQDLHDRIEQMVQDLHPDVIFHLAAIPRVSFSVEHPYETAHANVMGTIRVLDAVRQHEPSCRVVNSSSSSVYGGANTLPTPEDCPCDPRSPYALDKYQAEQWCKIYHDLYELDVVSLRYFNVFGPHSRYGGSYSTVLPCWLYSMIEPSVKPILEGDGEQSRDFCFIDNAVQANILAAERSNPFPAAVYNIAHQDKHSLLGIKCLLEQIHGSELKLERKPQRIGDVRHTLADISKARRELNYDPSTNFEQQVKVMYDWYQSSY